MLSYKVEDNLELRLHSKIYAEELNEVVRDNVEDLGKWLIWATEDYSVDFAKEFIKNSRKETAETELPNFFIFENGKLVGAIGFARTNLTNKSSEIGYWLIKDATGKGFITKCCKPMLRYFFEDLNFNRVIIRCEAENIKSVAIPERLGFVYEGTQRQSELKYDKFVDLKVYSMLKEEWK